MKLLGVDITSSVKKLAGQALSQVGIHVDTVSPQQHIAERLARAAPLKEAALNGNRAAWEQLWKASSRDLPVRKVSEVPYNSGPDGAKLAPGTCSSGGKTYPCGAGANPNKPFNGWPRVGGDLYRILEEIEAKWPDGIDSLPNAGQGGLDPVADAATNIGNKLTDALPEPAKKAVADTAKALGTTSSTVATVALIVGALLVIRALRS